MQPEIMRSLTTLREPAIRLINGHQWGFAPRIGIAWSPFFRKSPVRAGYGDIFNDRGELFSYLSPSAGAGFNGPFGVTLAPPFVSANDLHGQEREPHGAVRVNVGTTAVKVLHHGRISCINTLEPVTNRIRFRLPPGNLFWAPFLYGWI